jgi:hypothetical protein
MRSISRRASSYRTSKSFFLFCLIKDGIFGGSMFSGNFVACKSSVLKPATVLGLPTVRN